MNAQDHASGRASEPQAAAPACPDCGSARLRSLGPLPDVAVFAGRVQDRALRGGDLLHCPQCDLRLRWPRRPDYNALYDNTEVDAWAAGALRKDQRLVQARVEAQTGATSVLDFGCYSGGLLAQLPKYLRKYGVEVAKAPAAMAEARSGARVVSTLDEFAPELRFDIVLAMDVIEHVPSPRALLAALLARLSPGGSLVITTGDGGNALWRAVGSRWWYCYYPEHIAFISARWLHLHVAALGARIEALHTFNYLDGEDARARLQRWWGWFKYLSRPQHHARKRAEHLARHGSDLGVPGLGLTRDHLLVQLTK